MYGFVRSKFHKQLTMLILLQSISEMETYSCKDCHTTFARSLSLDRHKKIMHKMPLIIKPPEQSTSVKSEYKTCIDYSDLDLSLMSKINALLGIPMPYEIQRTNQFELEISQSDEPKDYDQKKSEPVKDSIIETADTPKPYRNSPKVVNNQNHQETPQISLRLKRKKKLTFPTTKRCKNDRLKCDKCEKYFAQSNILKEHIQSAHFNTFYSCKHCDKLLAYKHNLTRHLSDSHGQKVSTDQTKHFKIVKKKPEELQKSVKKVKTKNSAIFECHFNGCSKVFNLKQSVFRHYKSVHENLRFKCDQCEKEFMEKRTLRGHIRSMHQELKYKCDYCDKDFIQRKDRIVHNSKYCKKLTNKTK